MYDVRLRGEIVGVPNYDSLHSLVSNDREVCLDINNRKGEKCVSAIWLYQKRVWYNSKEWALLYFNNKL